MRDPKRISEILSYIEAIWQHQPDLRFNQLISNLQRKFHNETGMGMEMYGGAVIDLFHVEDDDFLEWLKRQI